MKLRGREFTPTELVAKLRSVGLRGFKRNLLYFAAGPLKRILVIALPRICSPARVPRWTGHQNRAELLQGLRESSWPLPPEGRLSLAKGIRDFFPNATVEAAEAARCVLEHEFDLLGSGPCALGPDINWLQDFKTGVVWPPRYYRAIDYSNLGQPSDVKVPWELSRCHQLVTLARAHLLTPSDEYIEEICAQLRSWISANPVGRTVNWSCTMEVAIRAVNWVWVLGVVAPELGDEELLSVLSSLVQHGFFIEYNLEASEIAGNHYISDALGLLIIGAYFRSSRLGERWIRKGGAILRTEIIKQTYPDGVDHEMSIPYHRLVTEIFLLGGLILRSVGKDPAADYWERVERMAEFIAAYTRPDGTAPVWGDADDGRILPFSGRHLIDHRHLLSTAAVVFNRRDFAAVVGSIDEDTLWLLGTESVAVFQNLGNAIDRQKSVLFPEGGFAILRDGAWHVVFDVGPVGLRGKGGHGHNDALAVELWYDGPLIVDPGSYVYTADVKARYQFRSTRAHNSPMLDDLEMNDVLGMWQLADQTHAGCTSVIETNALVLAQGRHVGYARFVPNTEVCRTVKLSEGVCSILDQTSSCPGRWSTRWTFAPSVTLSEVTTRGARIDRGDAHLKMELVGASNASLGSTWTSTSYGVRQSSSYLDVFIENCECEMLIYAE